VLLSVRGLWNLRRTTAEALPGRVTK
jgi:hypothetical protein